MSNDKPSQKINKYIYITLSSCHEEAKEDGLVVNVLTRMPQHAALQVIPVWPLLLYDRDERIRKGSKKCFW